MYSSDGCNALGGQNALFRVMGCFSRDTQRVRTMRAHFISHIIEEKFPAKAGDAPHHIRYGHDSSCPNRPELLRADTPNPDKTVCLTPSQHLIHCIVKVAHQDRRANRGQ